MPLAGAQTTSGAAEQNGTSFRVEPARAGRRAAAGNQPLRSLVVMHLADVSGPSRSLEDELRWLAGEGEMQVLVPGDGSLRSEVVPFAGVGALDYAALTVPDGPAGWIARVPSLGREVRSLCAAIRDTAPDLVIATSALLPTALLAARIEGARSLLYAGEILDEPRVPSRLRSLAGGALLRMAARSATAIVACSDRVGRQYAARGATNVTTIHPSIGARYAEGDGARFRREHGIPAKAELIVAVGALTHGRGQDVLIRALPAILQSRPGVRLAIVGAPHPRGVDLEYAQEIRHLAARLAPGAVSFTGFARRVEDAYAAAAVVVNPARYEAFGRVAFEALRAGRPVVSTSAGAVPEVLRDGQDALLVPPDSPGALQAAAVSLLADRDLAGRLAATGAARVRAEFTPASSLALFRDAVAGALHGRREVPEVA